MKSENHIEQLAYRAGVPKPILHVFPGPPTIIRWRDGDHCRDLRISGASFSDLEIEAEIRAKLKDNLTTIPPN